MKDIVVPFYNKIEKAIIIVFFTVMVVLTATNVITRYVFKFTPSWSEQTTRILFVWVSFAGVSWAGMIDAHMRVSAITLLTGVKIGKWVFRFGDVVAAALGFYISFKIFGVMMVAVQRGQVFSSMPWCPVWTMYLAGVLGMASFGVRIIQRLVLDLKRSRQKW